MTEFVNDERHVQTDTTEEIVWLSKIFDWYESDFLEWEEANGNRAPGLIDYVNRFRTSRSLPQGFRVQFLSYDKGINKQ